MDFRILGPLEVVDDGKPVDLGAAKPKALLGLLLVHANEPVPAEQLIEELWEGSPPRSAITTLQTYVSQLRKRLGAVLQSVPAGYSLRVGAESLDSSRFEDEYAAVAREASSDPAATSKCLRDALRWWRGPALVDFSGAMWAESERARLDGLRLVAIEDLTDARLQLGEHARLVPELEALVAAQPLRERLWGQLMLALYRSDRQAEALRAYRRVREYLGEELGIDPSSELARLEQSILLHAPALEWHPPAAPIAAATTASGETRTAPSGVVTFLMTDVVGSTRLWDTAPAAMAEALRVHNELIAKSVEAHSGRLVKERGEGDSTFAVFARATDALQAAEDAQTALKMQTWPAGAELSVRMAVHTGEAIERDSDYFGTAVNRAARLRSLALGGQVLVSQSTVALVVDHLPEHVRVVEIGTRTLSGLRRPELVYAVASEPGSATDEHDIRARRVEAARAEPGGSLPVQLRDDGPFVGRNDDVRVLTEAMQHAAAGRRQFVLITGEAGVGKTRLAGEVAGLAGAAGTLVLYGRCDDGLGVPYQPFVEALRSFIAACPPDALLERLGRSQGELSRLLPELADDHPELPPPVRSDAETERYRLFEAVVAWLDAASRSRPILLVLDDLQWATEPTLLLLRHLLKSERELHVLVVGTYRSDDARDATPLHEVFGRHRTVRDAVQLSLAGLARDDVGTLFDTVGREDHQPCPEDLVDAAYAVTRGVPFFIRETFRHLHDTGPETLTTAGVTTPGSSGALTIFHSVVAERLGRLSTAARAFVDAASVLGDDVDLYAIDKMWTREGERDVESMIGVIDEALAAHIIEQSSDLPIRYRFAHEIVRQTVYDSLNGIRRGFLHKAAAEAIELAYRRDLHQQLPALVYHWERAEPFADPERIVHYTSLAAQQALETLAYEEAIEYVNRALTVCGSGSAEDLERRADLLLILADAQYRLFRIADMRNAASAAADAARRARSPERIALAAIAFGQYAVAGVVDEESLSLCQEALGLVDEAALPAHRARLLAVVASHQSWAGKEVEAEDLSHTALELARRANDPDAVELALGGRYVALLGTPRLAERIAIADEMVNLGESHHRVDTLRIGLRLRAMTHLARGDLRAFDRDAYALEHFNEQIGSRFYRGLSAMWRGLRSLLDGDFNAAERATQELLGYADDPNFRLLYAVQVFALWSERGRFSELAPLMDVAAQMNTGITALHAGRAWLSLKLGDADAAGIGFDDLARNEFAAMRGRPLWPSSLHVLAELAVELGSDDVVEQVLQLLEPFAGQLLVVGTGTYCPGACDRYLGALHAAAGRYDEAESRFAVALELEGGLPSPPLVARTQYWYARMLRDRDADWVRCQQLLEAARATASELGIHGLLRDCEELARAR